MTSLPVSDASGEAMPKDPEQAIAWLYSSRTDQRSREVVDGQLLVREPAGGTHGQVVATACMLLGLHARQTGVGRVVGGEAGFILSRVPLTVVGADVAFISAGRWDNWSTPERFFDGAPDLAVEVLSPDDRPAEIAKKTEAYMNAGTTLLWWLDPKRRTVRVWTQGNPLPELLGPDDELGGGLVLPRFRCMVSELFE